jgi:hypothetical protein
MVTGNESNWVDDRPSDFLCQFHRPIHQIGRLHPPTTLLEAQLWSSPEKVLHRIE